jgi:predicted component of type VI protein secretion system
VHKLLIEDEDGRAVSVPLVREKISIGRQEGNTIRLTERNVSRCHARVVRQDDAFFVEDLASFVGTQVNGMAIEGSVPIKNGDVLMIGGYRITLKAESTGVAATDGVAGAGPPRVPPAAIAVTRSGVAPTLEVTLTTANVTAASDKPMHQRDTIADLPILTEVAETLSDAGAESNAGTRGAVQQAVGEETIPTDTWSMDDLPRRSSKKHVLIGVAVLAMAAGVGAFVLLGKKEPATGTAATEMAPALPAAVQPASAPRETPEALVAQARDAFEQEQLAEALALLDRAKEQGAPDGLEELRASVEKEREAETQYKTLVAAAGQDHAAVTTAYAAIPDGSRFKGRAKGLFDQSKRDTISQALAAAEEHTVALVKTQPRVVKTPSRVVARAEPEPREPRERPPQREVAVAATREAPEAVGGGESADALLRQAQQSWVRGQYAAAIDAARKALRAQPGLTRAYQIIAVCSCSLRQAPQARSAYGKLDAQSKAMVAQLCQKSGVTVP